MLGLDLTHQQLGLPGAATRVPKKDLQNPVRLIGQNGQVNPRRSQSFFFRVRRSPFWNALTVAESIMYTLFIQAFPAVDNTFREKLLIIQLENFQQVGSVSSFFVRNVSVATSGE